MKYATLAIAALFGLQLIAVKAGDRPIRLAVDLTDGSRVIGTSQNESIGIQSEIGQLRIPLRLVDQVRWKADREHVVLEFPSGDRLTGAVLPEIVRLHTLFGEAKISMEHIVMLKPLPAEVAALPSLDGLVLYFPFDEEPQGGIVASRVGQLRGKQQGGQWIRQPGRGGVFHFANENDAIVLADQEALRPSKLTISIWVHPDQSAHGSSYRGILAKSTSGSWARGFGLARYPGSPDVHFFVNYYATETAHAPIPDGAWTHLAGTYDEHTLTLFVNGAKVATATPQGRYGGAIQHGNSPLLIGQAPDGYGWFGKIDDVMLFDRVLTDHEISRVYQLTRRD